MEVIDRAKAYLEGKGATFQHVDKDLLREFIEHIRMERGAEERTIANHFAILSTFYDYLTFEEVVPSNPVLHIRKRYLKQLQGQCANAGKAAHLNRGYGPPH